MANEYAAPAVEKLIDIIELMARENRGFGVNEIARQLDIPVNTVFRVCRTMEGKGYFSKDENTTLYQLDSKFFTLGRIVGDRIDLRTKALPVMKQLRDTLGETVHLCVLRENRMVLLDKVETLNKIRIDVEAGSLMYPHASAFGKCLLACEEQKALEKIIENGLERLTPNTIVQPAVLMNEIVKVRHQGYAFDMEEYMDGVRCIGAPVHDGKREGVAAIGIMGPAYRVTPGKMQETVPIVMEAAKKLSEELGYQLSINRQMNSENTNNKKTSNQ